MRRTENVQTVVRASGFDLVVVAPTQTQSRLTVWDKTLLLNEFKDTRVASTVATSSHVGCTIQNVLDAQVDLVSGCVAGDFDAVAQRREGPVRPAASAVLWNVLVQSMGCVTLSVNVAPVPVVLRFTIASIEVVSDAKKTANRIRNSTEEFNHQNFWNPNPDWFECCNGLTGRSSSLI